MVLSCDDPDGTCYITTANLDGETNLKVTGAFWQQYKIIFSVTFSTNDLKVTQVIKVIKSTSIIVCAAVKKTLTAHIDCIFYAGA